MNQTFKARYSVTLDDYRVFSKAFRNLTPARRIVCWLDVIVGVMMLVVAVYSAANNDIEFAIFAALLAVLLACLRLVVAPWQQRRQFEHQRLGEHPVEMIADEDGFESNSALTEGRQKWAGIRQVDDGPEHVFLWPNNRIGWIVPKRAFASQEEAEAFAKFAKEKTAGQKL